MGCWDAPAVLPFNNRLFLLPARMSEPRKILCFVNVFYKVLFVDLEVCGKFINPDTQADLVDHLDRSGL